ncbi:MAG: hypothetical protein LBQ47_03585, partial [Endomicrobium sp.]|nr:hypothetical protein [Endomicrobium sp.]
MENKEEKTGKETGKEKYSFRARVSRVCGVRQQEVPQVALNADETADAAHQQPAQPSRQNGGGNNGNVRPQGNNSRPVMDARE